MERADHVGVKHEIMGSSVQNYGNVVASVHRKVVNEKEMTRAKNTAYRYLSYRPRSRVEVEQKLVDKGFSRDITGAVLADLARFGYIDDHVFARQWAGSRIRLRGFGRRRIEQELRGKGVDPEIIRDILRKVFLDSSETEIARREAEKKLKTLTRVHPEARRRRLAGFLERKGFSSEIIHSIVLDLKNALSADTPL